jgi:D-arabinose 1-dehydrogenase-like Zn-dependent alcohol dehydrogenase
MKSLEREPTRSLGNDATWCSAGRERFCPKQTNFGYTMQGALGDHALAPASALVRVPGKKPASR